MFKLTLSDVYKPMQVLNCPGWTVQKCGKPKNGKYQYYLLYNGRRVKIDGKPVKSGYLSGEMATTRAAWDAIQELQKERL